MLIGESCTWFSVDDLRNGVTLLSSDDADDAFEILTVTEEAELFDNTRAIVPVVVQAAVDSKLELREVDVSRKSAEQKQPTRPLAGCL